MWAQDESSASGTTTTSLKRPFAQLFVFINHKIKKPFQRIISVGIMCVMGGKIKNSVIDLCHIYLGGAYSFCKSDNECIKLALAKILLTFFSDHHEMVCVLSLDHSTIVHLGDYPELN